LVLVCGRIGGDEFGKAENGGVVSGFALNFVNASPGRFLALRRLCVGKIDFHFEAVEFAAKRNGTRSAGRMTTEAVLAGRNDGSLKFENSLVTQTRSVREIAGGTTDGGDQALVRIHANGNLMGRGRHG